MRSHAHQIETDHRGFCARAPTRTARPNRSNSLHCVHREDVLQVVDEVLALMKVPASSTAKAKAVAVERYRDTSISPDMSLAAFEKAMQASLAAIDGGLSDTERDEAMNAARFAFERERISAADTVFPKSFAARLVGRGLEEAGAAADEIAKAQLAIELRFDQFKPHVVSVCQGIERVVANAPKFAHILGLTRAQMEQARGRSLAACAPIAPDSLSRPVRCSR